MNLTLRPTAPGDAEFLYRVYAGTREAELALVDWDEAEKAAFLRMQFVAQDAHYREHYPGAAFQVILADGTPAGRLYVHRRPHEIRIMDIALLPTFRNRGIGTSLLRDLQADGAAAGTPVTIHVERFNPALRLYERLGFRAAADRGVYLLLEWTPGAAERRLGEDGLVPHPLAVRPDRHQEQLEGSDRGVLEPVDPLGQDRLRRPAEDEREWGAPAGDRGRLAGTQRRGRDQFHREGRRALRPEREPLPQARGEGRDGERFQHGQALRSLTDA